MGDSASAVRAGAFGGSRQGLREAETITEGSRLAGEMQEHKLELEVWSLPHKDLIKKERQDLRQKMQ